MIKQVLIADRGEIAVRAIRACQELGLTSVAVYSEADRAALHVRYADKAFSLGKTLPRKSYLRGKRMTEIAKEAGTDAIHPGYGPLAESATFARCCAEANITFIGPKPETIEQLGDKIQARQLARDLGLPVVEGSDTPLSDAEILDMAERLGYPVLLKAAAGGGGIGIRRADTPDEMRRLIPLARREALFAFNDDSLYVEQMVDHVRHIQIQILGDQHGNVIHLGERECSIRFRHHKLVEESPSLAVDEALRAQLCQAAVRFGQAIGFVGAGSVEFLLDREGQFYFIGGHPCLQAAHPVTEMVTGIDLVAEQIRVATGRALRCRQEDVQLRGTAIGCRVLAVDPTDFMPTTGRIDHLTLPGGPGVRVDAGVFEGGEVLPYYDPLLAKVTAWGETRGVAILRERRALSELQLVGVQTNLGLLLQLLDRTSFIRGAFDTTFVEERPYLPEAKSARARMAAALLVALLRHQGDDRAKAQQVEVHTSAWKRQARREMVGGGG